LERIPTFQFQLENLQGYLGVVEWLEAALRKNVVTAVTTSAVPHRQVRGAFPVPMPWVSLAGRVTARTANPLYQSELEGRDLRGLFLGYRPGSDIDTLKRALGTAVPLRAAPCRAQASAC
jgi:hypothetical protein